MLIPKPSTSDLVPIALQVGNATNSKRVCRILSRSPACLANPDVQVITFQSCYLGLVEGIMECILRHVDRDLLLPKREDVCQYEVRRFEDRFVVWLYKCSPGISVSYRNAAFDVGLNPLLHGSDLRCKLGGLNVWHAVSSIEILVPNTDADYLVSAEIADTVLQRLEFRVKLIRNDGLVAQI